MVKHFVFPALILIVLNGCLKSRVPDFGPEEYGQADTLSSLYISIFNGWDFKSLHPPITGLSFIKMKWDTVVDPARPTIHWEGNTSKAWNFRSDAFYDRDALSSRFKIHFLTDNLIDTTEAFYNDYGTYMIFPINKNLVSKPIVEIIDTAGNRNLLTLTLHKRNYLNISMDTSTTISWPPLRPSWKEMAKTFNKLFYSLDQDYLFQKNKY